jgi:hypothetical protein
MSPSQEQMFKDDIQHICGRREIMLPNICIGTISSIICRADTWSGVHVVGERTGLVMVALETSKISHGKKFFLEVVDIQLCIKWEEVQTKTCHYETHMMNIIEQC